MSSFGAISILKGVPTSRAFNITNPDDTPRDLAGLTPWFAAYDANGAVLFPAVQGSAAGSTVQFTIPATTVGAEVYSATLELKDGGGNIASDGLWTGVLIVDGGSPFNLCTVDDVKQYLDIDHAEDDARLAQIVRSVSEWFETQTGRQFVTRQRTEPHDGDGGRSIIPNHYPVTAVTSLTVDGTPVPKVAALGDTGWVLSGDVVRLVGCRATDGAANVSLVYTAGFERVPEDVRHAVIQLSAMRYRERPTVGTASMSAAGFSASFLPSIVPQSVKDVVAAYRAFRC